MPVSLPTPITSAIDSAADSLGYLSMLVLGMVLSKTNFKELFGNTRVLLVCFGRLIFYPFVMTFLFIFASKTFAYPALDNILLSIMFGSVTSAVGMTVDVLRNRNN